MSDLLLGIGLFGGIFSGIFTIPYVIAVLTNDKIGQQVLLPAAIAFIVCVTLGLLGVLIR